MTQQHDPDLATAAAVHPAALSLYTMGNGSLENNIAIGESLRGVSRYQEASKFFDRAFQLNPASYHVLVAKLLCIIASDQHVDSSEMELLKSLNIDCYRLARARLLLREGRSREALDTLGNSFEAFDTGSEADCLFVELATGVTDLDLRSDGDRIPRKLFFYWDKNPPVEVQQNIEYHRSLGAFEVLVFDRTTAAEFLTKHYGRPTADMFLAMSHPAAESDFFRLHAIYSFGGYYLDVDEQIISVETFFREIDEAAGAALLLSGSGPIHNAFFGAPRSSPIISECISIMLYNSFLHPKLSMWCKTGPGPITRAAVRSLYRSLHLHQVSAPMRIYHKGIFPGLFRAVTMPYRNDERDWRVFEAQVAEKV